jgi:hypothetical protein
MGVGDSMVVIGLVINNGPDSPLLQVRVSDPDGIDKYEVFSRFNPTLPVEVVDIAGCPKRDQESLPNFPVEWFPITVRVHDCGNPQNPQARVDKLHGPFDERGEPVPKATQPGNQQSGPQPKPFDLETATDLRNVPLVIDRPDVRKLLGVSDKELDAMIECGDLTAFGAGRERITKGSLIKLLGL